MPDGLTVRAALPGRSNAAVAHAAFALSFVSRRAPMADCSTV
ncbi:hypothetical protein BSIN_4907 [Burkholderia singularis]|uniref:Uncharacterized protein n=1 Tax=Burkholderia singularis TaxID=1503053 RepID=A0A238H9I1_9BURK|nr:hypothetical protein BSIN_4907 [Burkholderia singularis]